MQLRKDYFLERFVLTGNDRTKRPKQFKSNHEHHEEVDYFAPGNEHLTPPEIGRVSNGDSWNMRWFANKFPAVDWHGSPKVETHNYFYTHSHAFGYHEIIVETPDTRQLWDLSAEELRIVFTVYQQRVHALSQQKDIAYVSLFKNHGADAGCSLIHSHSQVLAQNIVPPIIMEKASHCDERCKYCEVIKREINSDRHCFDNEHFIAFTPYASRFPMEIWILPKRHVKSMDEFLAHDYHSLAAIMKKVLDKLKSLNAPYNFYLQHGPQGKDFHFHIEVIPRLSKWAGYEFSSGIIINSLTPEDAAKFYRE